MKTKWICTVNVIRNHRYFCRAPFRKSNPAVDVDAIAFRATRERGHLTRRKFRRINTREGENVIVWRRVSFLTGDDCDESRARSFPHGTGSGRGQLHVGAVDVTRLSARGPSVPRGPVHGQLRPLRPVSGLSTAAGVPGTPWYLHAALAFSPQPSQSVGTQSCFSTTRYVTISASSHSIW